MLERSTWKIQLIIAINFNSSKDVDEEGVMHSKNDNLEFMLYDNENELFVNELFESLLSRYQIGLETSLRGSDFIFESVQRFYYKCCKTNFKLGWEIGRWVTYWFFTLDKKEKKNNNKSEKYRW